MCLQPLCQSPLTIVSLVSIWPKLSTAQLTYAYGSVDVVTVVEFNSALQIYTTTLLLFYILKDVLLQSNEATNISCTPIQLLYNYYTANSSIYYNILYEQLIFVRMTAIGCTGKYVHLFYNWKDVLWVWVLLVNCW